MPPRPLSPRPVIYTGLLGIAVCCIALLPWWHNHDFLGDFYDYGLFINVNARLAEGQRPYADFTTPAQTAAFLLNYAAESLGGGTYVGMTRGAAALIVLGGLGLMAMLARRFNPWVAALLALAIIAGSASQHTIIFYNPIGVLALALVVWSSAVAPLLRRETVGWHVLGAAGLFLGGMNKINFHLLACAMAVGWLVLAWVEQKPTTARVLATFAFIGLFGLVLPIGLEIGWTGAGWREWYYNVVQLPLGARGGRVSYLFSPNLYFKTLHDYYGALRVPQVGLIGVLMPVIAVVAVMRAPGGGSAARKALQVLAGLLAALASSALLLTNNEIAYVTFAAALVITVGLWLGFKLPPRGGWFLAGVGLPALILAAAGWESAWRGQRSQFGHYETARSSFIRGEQCGPDFHYITGLHLPPRLAGILSEFAAWRGELAKEEKACVYYGPGVEWVEHIWPAHKVRGLPLVASGFDSQRETDLIKRALIGGDTFHHLVVLEAWDHWNIQLQEELDRTAFRSKLGSGLIIYRKLKPGTISARPLAFLYSGFESNVDSTRLTTDMPMHTLADHRRYVGIERGEGRLDADTPCHRMSAQYVLARAAPGGGELTAHLAIHANMNGSLLPRWSADVVLPADRDELVVTTEPVDGSGLPLAFTVTIPAASSGRVRAGWRALHLTDTAERDAHPPLLQSRATGLLPINDSVRLALLPDTLRDALAFMVDVRVQDGTVVLHPGAEAWVRLAGHYPQIKISAKLQGAVGEYDIPLRVVYYKGGHLESFFPSIDRAVGTINFSGWSPENDGWLGLLADPNPAFPPMTVRIDQAVRP